MKLEVGEHGDIILSEVYNGIGIKTDAGMFGIAERDGGIEVLLNGEPVYSHYPNGVLVWRKDWGAFEVKTREP